jgi:DUF3011 family protein
MKRQRRLSSWLGRAFAALCLMCVFTVLVAGQNGGSQIIQCTSIDGDRHFCPANTREGVRLERRTSYADCEEGYSWGYTARGVWVDRGCGGEFAVSRDFGRYTVLAPGTVISVRTNEYIRADNADYRVFSGTVDQDVRGTDGRLAIPRGSSVELIARRARDNDLILDLDSVTVNGQRYSIDTDTQRIESREGLGANRRTGQYIGGGAILGSIIGAIAGGGKGAAIGAAAGAAAGAGGQVITRGRAISIPAESLLTFRLERPFNIGVADRGIMREGQHYHDYYRNYDRETFPNR